MPNHRYSLESAYQAGITCVSWAIGVEDVYFIMVDQRCQLMQTCGNFESVAGRYPRQFQHLDIDSALP
jgi:hypothetical protein